jgi:hypothetical protein
MDDTPTSPEVARHSRYPLPVRIATACVMLLLASTGCSRRSAEADASVVAAKPATGTLEEVAAIPADAKTFEIWVPATLTMKGQPVRPDIAMAILVDDLLGKGFMPDGKVAEAGGATFMYRRRN